MQNYFYHLLLFLPNFTEMQAKTLKGFIRPMADWTCCIPLPRSSALVEITSEGSRLFTKSDMYIVDIDQLYFMKLFSRLRKYYLLISSKNVS